MFSFVGHDDGHYYYHDKSGSQSDIDHEDNYFRKGEYPVIQNTPWQTGKPGGGGFQFLED